MSVPPTIPDHRDQALVDNTNHTELRVGATIQAAVMGFIGRGAILSLATGHIAYLDGKKISWLSTPGLVPPAKIFRRGETFPVQVTKIKKKTNGHIDILVSRRALLPDPWVNIAAIHPVGGRFNARIVKFRQFGALAQLETGFIGLLHNNELSWTDKGEKVQSHFVIGDIVPVAIIVSDAVHHKLALSYRNTLTNPWQSIERDYPIGTRLVGNVDNIVKFGIFVRLPNRVVGLLYWSELKAGFADEYEYGVRIDVRVLSVDALKKRVALALDDQADQECPQAGQNRPDLIPQQSPADGKPPRVP